MRIAVVTASDPYDARSWSGTHRAMMLALEARGHEVIPLGPLDREPTVVERARSRLDRVIAGGRYKHRHGLAFSRWWGEQFTAAIRSARPDVVFAPAAAPQVAFVESAAPIVYLSDATWAQVVNDYPLFEGLSSRARRDGRELDRRATSIAAAIVYPSQWASTSAIREYQLDPKRVHVVPFGANLVPDERLRRSPASPARLLFVAADWHRKGGDVVLDAVRALRRGGTDASLTVCGCTPSMPVEEPFVRTVPFLDRNDPVAVRDLAALFAEASVFVLPTRADCYPIVLCEAAAFGLPVVASDAGGIPEAIDNGVSGIVLPTSASADAYADAIRTLVSDDHAYVDMAIAARERHERVLNWSAWSTAMTATFESVAP